ncbi:MAG: ImmA/IrrE family metallo-endopeptidase [Gemmataceae bacterium]
MVDDLERADVLDTIDRLVAELLRAARVEQPPVDAIALAQGHLGMAVLLDKRQGQRGRAQRSAGRKQIFLRPEPTEERHQWTVAHEIGEHFKSELIARLGLDPERTGRMTGESLANLFAHRLLVPTIWLASDAPDEDWDLLALKRRYATSSHEVIALRLLDLPEPCIITILDNGKITRRRSNAWPTRKRLESIEEKCQRHVNANSRPCRLQADGWTVQGWPVHQLEWKREILRSVVDIG